LGGASLQACIKGSKDSGALAPEVHAPNRGKSRIAANENSPGRSSGKGPRTSVISTDATERERRSASGETPVSIAALNVRARVGVDFAIKNDFLKSRACPFHGVLSFRLVQLHAADYVLHADSIASVHPSGDEVRTDPRIASVIAHVSLIADVRI